MKALKRNSLILTALFMVSLLVIVAVVTRTTADDSSDLRSRLNKVLLLEDNEQAKVIEISDIEKAKQDNAFYKNAQNGDYLFVFQNRVVIFRTPEDRIINVAPYLGGEDFDPEKVNEIDQEDIIENK